MTDDTNEELINYYKNLLILQYRKKDKAKNTIYALIKLLMIYDLMRDVQNGFDIDSAVGVQLGILGDYIGHSRTITGTTFDRTYFCYPLYSDDVTDNCAGFALYGENAEDVQFRRYSEDSQSLYDLNDEEYRTVLKLGIILNSSNYSTRETDNLVNQYFSGNVMFNDRMNMSVSYIFHNNMERLVTIAQSTGVIPKAMGVGASVSFIEDPTAMYNYVPYGADAASFSVGFATYGNVPNGSWLTY